VPVNAGAAAGVNVAKSGGLPSLPHGEDVEQLRLNREAHINRLGNLTLVTQLLNASLSNASWLSSPTSLVSKRNELMKRSVLLINQHLCQHDDWNEELIDARGADLTDRILRTWPGPTANRWPVAAEAGNGPEPQ
jgi:hypothetical protein